MARECFQIYLSLDGCSGRAVRYRVLTPSERDAVLLKAAQLTAGNGNVAPSGAVAGVQLRLAETREALKAMVVSVTDPVTAQDLPTATWRKVSPMDLEMPGPLQFDRVGDLGLFTAKDDAILGAAYRRHHDISAAEVELIVGKAVSVSED